MPEYVFEGDSITEIRATGERRQLASYLPPDNRYPSYRHGGYQAYTMPRPWDNVDRLKWPSTWRFLLKSYFLPSYHADTKWVNVTVIPAVQTPESTTGYLWEGD